MRDEGGLRWRKREALLEWSCRGEYGVMLHVVGIELKRGARMSIELVKHARLVRVIQGVFVEICVKVWIVGYHGSGGRGYLG